MCNELTASNVTGCDLKRGNIFTSQCQTLVNTVNCRGVMGAGIALEFKLRYPAMFENYVLLCRSGSIRIGKLWLYKPVASWSNQRRQREAQKWVLNFPTKNHWRYPSRIEYLRKGLDEFLRTYRSEGITSIAFPILGATNGGIPEDVSLEVMQDYLERCDIPVEIYRYDPDAQDDLYRRFKAALLRKDDREISREADLQRKAVAAIRRALGRADINSLSRLATVKGIGGRSLEQSFKYAMEMDVTSRPPTQQPLSLDAPD